MVLGGVGGQYFLSKILNLSLLKEIMGKVYLYENIRKMRKMWGNRFEI